MASLTQLEYIVAVDTCLHFGKAASLCFVTQPTLSMQIKKLEEELGLTLFDRSKQPVLPTEAGKAVIEQARNVLRENARITDIVNRFKEELLGEIRIGIIPTIAPYLIPLFIGNFIRKYPQVKVSLEELVTHDIVERLKKDTLDVGILVTPLHEAYIRESPLFYEEIFAYVHPGHSMAIHKKIKLDTHKLEDIWLLAEGHCFRHQMVNICSIGEGDSLNKAFHYESGSLESLIRLVDVEGGFTLLPRLATEGLSESQRKRLVPFTDPVPLREISIASVRNLAKTRLLNALYEHIVKSVKPELLDKKGGQIVEWNR